MRLVEAAIGLALFLPACKRAEPLRPPPAATVSGKKTEASLARIELTPAAAERLGIAVAPATIRSSARTRSVAGEVVPSSGRSLPLSAPVAGRLATAGTPLTVGQTVRRGDPLFLLTPVASVDRDLRASSGRAVSIAEARLEAMALRFARAEKLLGDGAGSAKAVEEARADRDSAKAELEAAKSRSGMLAQAPLDSDVSVTLRAPEDGVIRTIAASPSSIVPAGAPLLELVGTSGLWVRVNIFVGDLRAIRPSASVRVRGLTARPDAADVEAFPMSAPPTADALTSSAELHYALPKEARFVPGERVAVSVAYSDDGQAIHVPSSAIVRDVTGAAWVYTALGENAFERVRVEVESVDDGDAKLSRGLAAGAPVVITGASELFGVEFGGGK